MHVCLDVNGRHETYQCYNINLRKKVKKNGINKVIFRSGLSKINFATLKKYKSQLKRNEPFEDSKSLQGAKDFWVY